MSKLKPWDEALRSPATCLATAKQYGLTPEQIAENVAWYAKWDVYDEAMGKYDDDVIALHQGSTANAIIPKMPLKFWGKGVPKIPHSPTFPKPPRKKMGRPPQAPKVFVRVGVPLDVAQLIEAQRGSTSAAAFIETLVTSVLRPPAPSVT